MTSSTEGRGSANEEVPRVQEGTARILKAFAWLISEKIPLTKGHHRAGVEAQSCTRASGHRDEQLEPSFIFF